MNIPNLCPACLTELPDNYPWDHVAIDRALDTDRRLFRGMNPHERAEVVKTGLRRGLTLNQIAERFHLPFAYIRGLAADDMRPSQAELHAHMKQQIGQLWAEGLDDGTIALHLNRTISSIAKARWRMKLPANYGPRGRRIKQAAA